MCGREGAKLSGSFVPSSDISDSDDDLGLFRQEGARGLESDAAVAAGHDNNYFGEKEARNTYQSQSSLLSQRRTFLRCAHDHKATRIKS